VLVSYAQNFEDLVLDRALRGVASGFYIDVGAGDPVNDSVTHLFHARGWRGINVEPDRRLFARLAAARPRDVNLDIAIGERAETRPFFELSVLGLSSLDAECAAMAARGGVTATETTVAVQTLAEMCRRHADAPIDFLKVDVEGWERQVLASHDWQRFRPKIVLVEATQPNTKVPSHEAWEGSLLAQDYLFACFDGLNRFYVDAAHRELVPIIAAPPRFLADGAVLHREIAMRRRAEAAEQEAERLARAAGEAERVRQAAEARAAAAVQQEERFARQAGEAERVRQAAEARAAAAVQQEERFARQAGEAERVRQAAEARAEAAVQRAAEAAELRQIAEARANAAEQAYAAWARSPVGRLAHFLRLHRRREL